MRTYKQDLSAFNKNWKWNLSWGTGLSILGIIAICASVFTTYLTVVIIGALFLVSGIFMIINTFQYWWSIWPGFFAHLFVAGLYLAVGLMIVLSPTTAAITITILLASFFIIIGFFRIIFSAFFQIPSWQWMFFSGLISLLLGILILAQLPASGLFIIGMFIGIDLFFWGWSYIMLALLAKRLRNTK